MRIKGIKNLILCIVFGFSCAVYGAMTEWGYLAYDTSTGKTNIITASLGKVGELRWENEKTTLYLDTALLGSGTGDVTGPAFSIADRIVIFDGITGKIIKDSGVGIVTTLANPGSDTNVPSEKAVRDVFTSHTHSTTDTTSGTFDDARIPAGVTRDSEWDSLSELNTALGVSLSTAGHTQAWSTITSTPTTLATYGITDAEPIGSAATAVGTHESSWDHDTAWKATGAVETVPTGGTGVTSLPANGVVISGVTSVSNLATATGTEGQIMVISEGKPKFASGVSIESINVATVSELTVGGSSIDYAIASNPQSTTTKALSTTLTVAEMVSGSVYCTTAANTLVLSLPQTSATQGTTTIKDGTVTCFYCTTAKGLNLNPDGADQMCLNGACDTAGHSIENTSGAVGDFICIQAAAGNKIYTWGKSGTWADGG